MLSCSRDTTAYKCNVDSKKYYIWLTGKATSAVTRYEAAKASYDSIIAQIAEEHKRIQRMQAFIRNVQDVGIITEFDETLWGLLVDKVVVYSKDDIRVEFKK